MQDLIPELNERLAQVLLALRLTLLNGRRCPQPSARQAAIVSTVPDFSIDSGRGEFGGRRRRMAIDCAKGRVSILARTRPLQPRLDPSGIQVVHATTRQGCRLPVAALDRGARTIHALLDFGDASVDPVPGRDPLDLLVTALFAEPLEALLQEAAGPSVGPDVCGHVRRLMSVRPWDGSQELREEMSVLRAYADAEPLPGYLARRLELLRQAFRSPRRSRCRDRSDVSREAARREVERMTKLVASRACAWLHFGPSGIDGLINPGHLGRQLRLYPRRFRIRLGPSGLTPVLHIWSLNRPGPVGSGECLDKARPVLEKMDSEAELFGLIDAVINFRETNEIGAVPVHRRAPRERLAEMFSAIF